MGAGRLRGGRDPGYRVHGVDHQGGVLFGAVRLFGAANVTGPVVDLVALLPLLSIVWGNLAAMRQQSFRRMIAYSSIAHAGYLFYAFLGDAAGRFQAVAFYVVAYGSMNLLAFARFRARR
jgi:NADH-quinone oxidoreductase subunit N